MKISELSDMLGSGKVSSAELVSAALDGAEKDPFGCFISVTDRKKALSEAEAADRRRAAGTPLSALDGLPAAVKDNILAYGERNTCGSAMLEDFIAPYDAAAVERLNSAGCVIVGKTNMDEFGMGSSTENSAFFRTENPRLPGRVPGGSSGGSAAAVAAGYVPLALGSDTGGSVRQPAAFCGVTGLKPTYGAVPRYGLTAFASSLDVIGVIAEDPGGCAAAARIIYGRDARDATSRDMPAGAKLPGRFAVPEEMLEAADPAVRETVLEAAGALSGLGMEKTEITLSSLKYALASYYIISSAEASSNLARFDGIRYGRRAKRGDISGVDELMSVSRREGFGHEVKRRILLGSFALSEGQRENWYGRAMAARRIITEEMEKALGYCGMILAPVSPVQPWRLGETPDDPAEIYKADIMTVPASLAGLPAVSLPFGESGGFPGAVQLIGKQGSDMLLLEIAGRLCGSLR